MKLQENELKIRELEDKLLNGNLSGELYKSLKDELDKLKEETYQNLSAWDRVTIARSSQRPKGLALIEAILDDFIELKGDQYYQNDNSVVAGLGFLKDKPVTIIAQTKGRNLEENILRNFGMTSPEGFRKSLRLAKEAEKFNRPIITIVDTSGAYPGKGAEERGQSRAIASNLMEFMKLEVPVIAIVLSEGGSGGALALTVSDYIYMFENAIYSVLSPEGCSSILFKNTSNVKEVAQMMKLTSYDLLNYGIIDEIVKEPLGGMKYISDELKESLKDSLYNKICELNKLDKKNLLSLRYQKFRKIGVSDGN